MSTRCPGKCPWIRRGKSRVGDAKIRAGIGKDSLPGLMQMIRRCDKRGILRNFEKNDGQ